MNPERFRAVISRSEHHHLCSMFNEVLLHCKNVPWKADFLVFKGKKMRLPLKL